MRGKQNTEKYLKRLEEVILPHEDDFMPANWIFMQENAPIHTNNMDKIGLMIMACV